MTSRLKNRLKSTAPWLFWFFTFNLVLIQIVSLRYITETQSYPAGIWATLFLFFYWCGHLFSLVALFGLFWILVTLIFPSLKLQKIILPIIATFMIFLLAADTFVYAQYRFHLNLLVLDLYFNAHGQVIELAWQSWAKALAVVAVILCLEFAVAHQIAKRLLFFEWSFNKFAKFILAFYIFATLAAHGSYVAADAVFYNPITKLGWVFPLAAPAQAQSFLAAHGLVDIEEYKKRKAMQVSNSDRRMNYPLKPMQCQLQNKKYNILFILVDALRADDLNENVMPNTFALTEKSQTFGNHFSGSNTTRYGVFNIFYGLPGVYFESALSGRISPVLMDELQRQDYQFGIFGSAPLDKPEFDQTVFAKIPNLKILNETTHDYSRDMEITHNFASFIDKLDPKKPFYSFLFYDSCHGYGVPPSFKNKFLPIMTDVDYLKFNKDYDPTPLHNTYRNSANFVDTLIAQVLAKLKEKKLDDSTIILVSSDHGQEFNDNHLNYWGHNSNYSDVQTHVPLAIYWPHKAPQKFTHRTAHYDIAPTFMKELFDCQNDPRDYSSGNDLFDKKTHPWLIMGRRDDFAIYRDNDIVVVNTTGDYDVVDHTYHPLAGAQLDGDDILKALDELRRFF